jgi:chemotaxis protein MotA
MRTSTSTRAIDGPRPGLTKIRTLAILDRGASTLFGALLASFGIVGGFLLDGGDPGWLFQPAAALIVSCGTLGALLVSYPLVTILESARAVSRLFTSPAPAPDRLADELLAVAGRARRLGFLALQRQIAASTSTDSMLRRGIEMLADGQDPRVVRQVLDRKLCALEESLELAPAVLESAGGYAPTIGILGAVVGLIQVLVNLGETRDLGSGLATAFVATLYGVGLANLVLLPLATKLRLRQREELQSREMVVEGVVSMGEGLDAYAIADRLGSILGDEHREAA